MQDKQFTNRISNDYARYALARNPITGLLHRSPPIEGTGETRLVLVLDPIDDLDEELDENILH